MSKTNLQSSIIDFGRFEGKSIRIPNFEISWAGETVHQDGFWFGSDDGRLTNVSRSGKTVIAPFRWLPSGEAINSVAFSGLMMALSSRSEVIFVEFDSSTAGGGGSRTIHDGGAHGVLATSSGGFVAPLGLEGLLTLRPSSSKEQPMTVSAPEGKKINLYKLAHVFGDGSRDLFIGAVRRDGLLALDMATGLSQGPPDKSRILKAPGIDIIDVCSLSSSEWPYAAAGLGHDRSIHLWHNILGVQPPQALRFEAMMGSAYKIIHSHGHLLTLTSDALYVFPNLIERYLNGEYKGGETKVRIIPMDAFDACILYDELVAFMAGFAIAAPLDVVAGNNDLSDDLENHKSTPSLLDLHWDISQSTGWVRSAVA